MNDKIVTLSLDIHEFFRASIYEAYDRKVQTLLNQFESDQTIRNDFDFIHINEIKNITLHTNFAFMNELSLQQQLYEDNVHKIQAITINDLDETLLYANQDAENIVDSFENCKNISILSEIRFKYLYEKLKTKLNDHNKEIDQLNGKIRKQKQILDNLKMKSFYLNKKQMISEGKLHLEWEKVTFHLTLLRREANVKKKKKFTNT